MSPTNLDPEKQEWAGQEKVRTPHSQDPVTTCVYATVPIFTSINLAC